MKHMKPKRLLAVVTMLCVVLAFGGCAAIEAVDQLRQQQSSGSSSPNSGSGSASVPGKDPSSPAGEPAPATGKDTEDPSYLSFTKQLCENGMLGGVAYIGSLDGPMEFGQEGFWETFGYGEDYAFLEKIPQERWVDAGGYHLFCIVPADLNASLAVNQWIADNSGEGGQVGDVLYRSDSGEPILLFCDNGPFSQPNAQVNIVDNNGTAASFFPQISPLDGYLSLGEWGGDFIDFTQYDGERMGAYYYEEATPESLLDSSWIAWDVYDSDGAAVVCGLEFYSGSDGSVQMEYWYGPPESERSERFEGSCYLDQATGFIAFDMTLTGGSVFDEVGPYQYNGEFLILYYPELDVIDVMNMDGYPLLYGMEGATISFERMYG